MEQIQDKIHIDDSKRSFIRNILIKLLMLGMVLLIWQVVAKYYHNDLLLPEPGKTIIAFFGCLADKEIMKNLLLTLRRVLNGFLYALIIGLPLGFLMGSFKLAEDTISGFIDSVRQVPIMAWVPLTIVWFGIGDGPTVFLIAFTGVFPIILNTIQGVHNISKDYYNAAKSMGAGPLSIFLHIVVPATIPDILTGARIAISTGWMSVIWAEFIATSAGLGYSMVEAQTRMHTEILIGLMILAALVGFAIDRGLLFINKSLTSWRYVK